MIPFYPKEIEDSLWLFPGEVESLFSEEQKHSLYSLKRKIKNYIF
jgi:hypothetical protein